MNEYPPSPLPPVHAFAVHQTADESSRKSNEKMARRDRAARMEQLAEDATNKAVAIAIKLTIERRVKKLVEEQEDARRAAEAARQAAEERRRAVELARRIAEEQQVRVL